MAVNISVGDLASLDLASLVTVCLDHHRFDRGYLILEITENVAMRDGPALSRSCNVCERPGEACNRRLRYRLFVAVAVEAHAVDELKIGRSFVLGLAQGGEDAVIVKSTIELGHNIGLRVVAEGVEDERSWELLRANRCDMAQVFS